MIKKFIILQPFGQFTAQYSAKSPPQSGSLLMGAIILFASRFFDPVVNYYGVRMRESQLQNFIMAHNWGQAVCALYCYGQPLANLHEQSICFDCKDELDGYVQRR